SLEVNSAGIGENILGLTGKINIQGEEVQKLDEFSDITFTTIMGKSKAVCAITSEEKENPYIVPSSDNPGKYIFMMDPLDGSSNIDVNVNIGTIFSVYRKKSPGDSVTEKDLLQKGIDQVAAGYIVYGSSTIFVYTSGQGVHGFTLDPSLGEFFLSHPDIKIPEKGSIYSTNEGNWGIWDENQKNLVSYLKEDDPKSGRPYKLRYIGSLVADFHRTLLKGGLFMYPKDTNSPKGKLRFCFEAAPLAFIVENAGGKASTGDQRILDIKPKGIHERLPLFIGSKKDVEMAESHLASTVKKGGWFKWLSG
ncbi:MAG: class 1 fructose-bisphosphatase, partial [Nitrospinota bacterium]|nr:class 1 fructose-bisphosphatase [Nitrospinota bacterium]